MTIHDRTLGYLCLLIGLSLGACTQTAAESPVGTKNGGGSIKSTTAVIPKSSPTAIPKKERENKQPAVKAAPKQITPKSANPSILPAKATEKAPAKFAVRLETTKGNIDIDFHREWAPNGADRFFNLVKLGFYSDVAFFRVIPE